jgi:hypothetical protein
MASADPGAGHPGSSPDPVALHSLGGIVGAGGKKAALPSEQGRETQLIGADQPERDPPSGTHHRLLGRGGQAGPRSLLDGF